jgi:hypothetical protein
MDTLESMQDTTPLQLRKLELEMEVSRAKAEVDAIAERIKQLRKEHCVNVNGRVMIATDDITKRVAIDSLFDAERREAVLAGARFQQVLKKFADFCEQHADIQ